MNGLESIASAPMWAGFIAFVLLMLALDLFVFGGNKAHKVSVKEAAIWSLVSTAICAVDRLCTWLVLRAPICTLVHTASRSVERALTWLVFRLVAALEKRR